MGRDGRVWKTSRKETYLKLNSLRLKLKLFICIADHEDTYTHLLRVHGHENALRNGISRREVNMYVGATMAYQPYTECTTLGIRPNICMRGESEWERERDWSYKTLPVGRLVLREGPGYGIGMALVCQRRYFAPPAKSTGLVAESSGRLREKNGT